MAAAAAHPRYTTTRASPVGLGRDDVPGLGGELPLGPATAEQLDRLAGDGLEDRVAAAPPALAVRPLVGLADHHDPRERLVEVVAVHRRRYQGQRLRDRPADPRRPATGTKQRKKMVNFVGLYFFKFH